MPDVPSHVPSRMDFFRLDKKTRMRIPAQNSTKNIGNPTVASNPILEDFRVEIVPARGEMLRVSMSKYLPEKSSDPAHRAFYSHILGFRRLPTRFASLFPEVYRVSLRA